MTATDCCEPGCTAEVLCPVHQALADVRDAVEALRRQPLPWVPIDDVLALFPGGQHD